MMESTATHVIVILTIKRRMHLALATKQSLLDVGVQEEQIHIIEGYDKEDYKGMLRPHLLLSNAFMEFILPYAVENNTSIFYTECGTLFNCNPFDISIEEDRINWLGYIRNMKWYIIGTKLIYLPLTIIKDMVTNPPPMAHLDRMIRNYGRKNDCLVVADETHISQMNYASDWGTVEQLKRKENLKNKIKKSV